MVTKWRSKVLQNAPIGAFCNTFDLRLAIIRLENQFMVFLRAAILHMFRCILVSRRPYVGLCASVYSSVRPEIGFRSIYT